MATDEIRRRVDSIAERLSALPDASGGGTSGPGDPAAAPEMLGAGSDDLDAGRRYLEALDDAGLAVPTWPVDDGGLGLDADGAAAVARLLARLPRPDLYPYAVGLGLVGPVLVQFGSTEQRGRWLPGIRRGADIWCQLFSEPGAGSDLAGLACRAEPDGDGWRVTGQKVWASRAHYATWGLLVARTDPGVPKHQGITAFGIRLDQPGVEVRPLRQMNGDAHFNEVFLDRARVDDADRIAGEGDGWTVARATLAAERSGLGGGGGGLGGSALGTDAGRRLVTLARARGAWADPVRRDAVMRVWVALEVARLSARRARDLGPGDRAGAGMKLRLTKAVQRAADVAMAIEGPAAVVAESAWETFFLTAPSLSIRGGTDEIQRNVVAERVLGLFREPRDDAAVPFRELPRN